MMFSPFRPPLRGGSDGSSFPFFPSALMVTSSAVQFSLSSFMTILRDELYHGVVLSGAARGRGLRPLLSFTVLALDKSRKFLMALTTISSSSKAAVVLPCEDSSWRQATSNLSSAPLLRSTPLVSSDTASPPSSTPRVPTVSPSRLQHCERSEKRPRRSAEVGDSSGGFPSDRPCGSPKGNGIHLQLFVDTQLLF